MSYIDVPALSEFVFQTGPDAIFFKAAGSHGRTDAIGPISAGLSLSWLELLSEIPDSSTFLSCTGVPTYLQSHSKWHIPCGVSGHRLKRAYYNKSQAIWQRPYKFVTTWRWFFSDNSLQRVHFDMPCLSSELVNTVEISVSCLETTCIEDMNSANSL